VALRHWLTGALAGLTLRERAVIVMRYLFDLPEAAVARDLGITVGTVKSTGSRALAKMRLSAKDDAPGSTGLDSTGLDRTTPVGGDRK
jgi:DNA-directed RNA polymerase specialized sigma24 family protein